MTELANRKEAGAMTLAHYEARIELYKEQIGTGYIGIGKTLNEAKEAGVVAHGEWEAWVTRVTGLTPRQAQRCMQAATEIRDGSALAKLEMSKALMLLSSGLDEETRENVAEKAAEDGVTVRQLKEEIARIRKEQEAADAENRETVKALKVQVVKESGTAAEIRQALKKAENDKAGLEQQLRATIAAYQGRLDEETGKAYKRGSDEGRLAAEKEKEVEIRKEFQGKLAGAQSEAEKRTREIQELKAELEAAEAREAKRAAELAEMKKARNQAGMDAARGIGAQVMGAVDLGAAVRDFIGRAGVLPQMGAMISGMGKKDREAILAQVETVGKWVSDSLAALGVVKADARIQ